MLELVLNKTIPPKRTNEPSMSLWNIPEEYRELSERKAANLAGVSRSAFRRRHLEADAIEVISLCSRQDGSKFIPFEEIHRIYGEKAILNLKKLQNEPKDHKNHSLKSGSEQNDTTKKEPMNQKNQTLEQISISVQISEYISLKTKLASQATELEELKKRLNEQKYLLDQAKDREKIEQLRTDRLLEELQTSRRLIEDKLSKIQTQNTHPLAFLWPGNWNKKL